MYEVVTLAEAKAQGLTHYFTGKPCKHGHVALRSVSQRACVECIRAASRRFRANNLEKERARGRRVQAKLRSDPVQREKMYALTRRINNRRYATDPDWRAAKLAKTCAWAASPRGKALLSARQKERLATDPEYREVCKRRTDAWLKDPKHAVAVSAYRLRQQTRRAQADAVTEHLTPDEMDDMVLLVMERDELNEAAGETAWHIDHIVPVVHGGLTVPWNLRLLPATENLVKRDRVDWSESVVRSILVADIAFLARLPADLDTDALVAQKHQQLHREAA